MYFFPYFVKDSLTQRRRVLLYDLVYSGIKSAYGSHLVKSNLSKLSPSVAVHFLNLSDSAGGVER